MKKLTTMILSAFMGLVMISVPVMEAVDVFAASSCVQTSIIGASKCKRKADGTLKKDSGGTINCSCDSGNGSATKHVLKLVVQIMTVGIGVLGVIGITIVGIQYLTAGGNEEKTRKAKRRMLEIVIGLAAYVVIFALMNWLIPDFKVFDW